MGSGAKAAPGGVQPNPTDVLALLTFRPVAARPKAQKPPVPDDVAAGITLAQPYAEKHSPDASSSARKGTAQPVGERGFRSP